MPEYNFTLIVEGDVENHLDELFEAGCDDATFGTVDGVHYVEFDREAERLPDAVTSAISNIESVPGLRVARVEPDDLVTQAEIARKLGRSRESIRLLAAGKRGGSGFPSPVSHLRGQHRLWRWSDVAAWAGADTTTIADASFVSAVNAALELRCAAARLPADTWSLVSYLTPRSPESARRRWAGTTR
jgi:hypothetical protein